MASIVSPLPRRCLTLPDARSSSFNDSSRPQCCRWPINYNADLAKFVTEALPFSVLWHLAFAFWAFSFIAVARSPLVGGSLMGLLTAFSSAMTHVWANTSQMTVEQVRSVGQLCLSA